MGPSPRPSPRPPRARPAMESGLPWQRRQPQSTSPHWMRESAARLEEKRVTYGEVNRKRQREFEEQAERRTAGHGGSGDAGASSSTGLDLAVLPEAAAGSSPEQSLPPVREEDMRTFRHASITPASFATSRHLFMCCGRPMVVQLVLASATPPPILSIRGIGPLC